MEVGSTVWTAFTAVHHGEPKAFATLCEIVAVVDDVPVLRIAGSVRQKARWETVFATEAEAWAHCAKELEGYRAAIDAAIADAKSKAAAEAVAA